MKRALLYDQRWGALHEFLKTWEGGAVSFQVFGLPAHQISCQVALQTRSIGARLFSESQQVEVGRLDEQSCGYFFFFKGFEGEGGPAAGLPPFTVRAQLLNLPSTSAAKKWPLG